MFGFIADVSVTKTQLTWVTYVLFVYQYSVSITRNVRPVGEYILHLILLYLSYASNDDILIMLQVREIALVVTGDYCHLSCICWLLPVICLP